MSKEKSPKEVSGLLQLACAVHAMDPRTRHLLQDAARLLDDYAALPARHNALWNFYNQLESAMYEFEKEARVERMKRVAAERFAARYKEIATTAVARHAALVEAVAWERECSEVIWPAYRSSAYMELIATKDAARADVDRMIAEGEG